MGYYSTIFVIKKNSPTQCGTLAAFDLWKTHSRPSCFKTPTKYGNADILCVENYCHLTNEDADGPLYESSLPDLIEWLEEKINGECTAPFFYEGIVAYLKVLDQKYPDLAVIHYGA